MSYSYKTQRPALFTEDGVEILMAVRDKVRQLLKLAGAVRSSEATDGVEGDTHTQLAALDYLVEKGEIREVTDPALTMEQHRIFTRTGR